MPRPKRSSRHAATAMVENLVRERAFSRQSPRPRRHGRRSQATPGGANGQEEPCAHPNAGEPVMWRQPARRPVSAARRPRPVPTLHRPDQDLGRYRAGLARLPERYALPSCLRHEGWLPGFANGRSTCPHAPGDSRRPSRGLRSAPFCPAVGQCSTEVMPAGAGSRVPS
jgi:hypothetical protein